MQMKNTGCLSFEAFLFRSVAGRADASLVQQWLVLRDVRRVLARLPAITNLLHFLCNPPSTRPMSSAMDKSELEYRCNCLRQELKVWEKTFSLQHDGRKAGRDDIKADVAICMHTNIPTSQYFQLTASSAKI